MKIQPVGRPTLPDVIVEQIRTQILLGELGPGDELPSEREFAAGYGVNRTTVREALMELTRMRLIERKQGRRCTVLDYRDSGSPELLTHILRLPRESPVRQNAAVSLFDAIHRAYLTAAELVVGSQRDLSAVSETVDDIEAALADEDVERVFLADRAFHRELFRATGSIVLELMFVPLFRAVDDGVDLGGSYGRRAAKEYIARRERNPTLPHRAILDGLRAGDLDAVGKVIERVLRAMRRVYERAD